MLLLHAKFPQTSESDNERRDIIWRAERTCGLNCAYLMLRAHDRDADYVALHDALIVDRLTSLADIRSVAAEQGLPLNLAHLTPQELKVVEKPVIAHLDIVGTRGESMGHFVVVTNANDESVTFVDGTTAETIQETWSEFRRRWSGAVAYASGEHHTPLWTAALAFVAGVTLGHAICATARIRLRQR